MRPRTHSLLHASLVLALSLGAAGCAATGAPPGDALGTDDGSLASDPWFSAPRVLVIDWDPRLESRGDQRGSSLPGYTDPHALAEGFVANMRAATGDVVRYEVAEWIEIDGYPPQMDGSRPTDWQWLACLADADACGLHGAADYAAIVEEYDLCARVERGEIDEVWLFGGPWFGFYESRMAGTGAFAVNSPPLTEVACSRRFVMMGFNYERGVAEMMHDVGHRLELTMQHGFRHYRARHPGTPDPFAQFRVFDAEQPGSAACGDTHHPPNSAPGEEYAYDSTTEVVSSCDAWATWPTLDAAPRAVSCADWGCTQEGYMSWLFERVPRQAGADAEGYQRNWWKYVYDFDTYLPRDGGSAPSEPPPSGTVPSGGTTPDCSALGRADCDARDDCEFFACAGACAPRGTWADDLCEPAQGCGVFDTIETCDMHRDRCAWYACADRCYPTGTPLERACPEAAPSCETSGTIETCAPRGPTCAWYACADRCYPNGLPLESACPDL